MSEKLTRIRIPDQKAFSGLQNWGVHDAAAMVRQVRHYADYMREQVARIDAAKDEDFQIDVVRGAVVQHHVAEVQRSALSPDTQAQGEEK